MLKMQPEEARARMLRLWVALSAPTSDTSSSSTASILTTQRYVLSLPPFSFRARKLVLVPSLKQTIRIWTNHVLFFWNGP